MDDIAELKKDVKALLVQVAAIQSLIETEAERCPYRELIAKSANNTRRLGLLEKFVYGGGSLGIIAAAVLKAMGFL